MHENKSYDSDVITKPSHNDKAHIIKLENRDNSGQNELLLTTNQPLEVPNFADEVRCTADAFKFSQTASFVLNSNETEMEVIVLDLLKKMFSNKDTEGSDESDEEGSELNKANAALEALIVKNSDHQENYFQFAKTMQGFEFKPSGEMDIDPTWLVVMASLPWLSHRRVGITSLLHGVNMSSTHHNVQTIAIVLAPSKEKATKNDVETGRNLAVVLAESKFRNQLHELKSTSDDNVVKARQLINEIANYKFVCHNTDDINNEINRKQEENNESEKKVTFGRGIIDDLKRRAKQYDTDYTDSFKDASSFLKTLTTIFFLFFANLLPTIAFGMLNESNTGEKINVSAGLIAQMIGGTVFGLLGGQHLTVLLTTAPLSIIILVLTTIGQSLNYPFYSFYAWVGIFNTIYLCIYAFFGLSKIMKFSTRSTEETFALFISIAFLVDSVKATVKSFNYYYYGEKCLNATVDNVHSCLKEESLLFLILMLGTVAIGLWLNGFAETPFLNSICRRITADFSLPVAVIFMSFIGSYVFRQVPMHTFNAPHWSNFTLITPVLTNLSWQGILVAAGMAVPLSILFFMDQNISSSIVNSPMNNLKKGASYHWDLIVVGLINLILSLFGLPWVHGALPHSPMHVRALATVEEHVDQSNHITYRVVKVVESRWTSVIANLMIGGCIFLMPYPLLYIPSPVLYGLFLFMAVTGVQHNQLFERLLLLFTEQSAYPPNHYLRRVPQKKVHIFTAIQTLQLLVLCVMGFMPIPYVKLFFPILLLVQLPIRHLLLPKVIDHKHLDALDKAI